MSSDVPLEIRFFTDDDYTAYAALWNSTHPENRATALALRVNDYLGSSNCEPQRWVAIKDGGVRGVASYERKKNLPESRQFSVQLIVDESYQQQGIGTRLYKNLEDELLKEQPDAVTTTIKNQSQRGVGFALKRGFKHERIRHFLSLEVPTCDVRRFAKHARRLARSSVEIKSFNELQGESRNRKLYELYCDLLKDVPSSEEAAVPKFNDYVRDVETQIAEASAVALYAGGYVGLCSISSAATSAHLHVDVLGVTRQHRHRGIALCLLIESIVYAQRNGYQIMTAQTDSHNREALALSVEHLGFTIPFSELVLRKDFAGSSC